MIYLKRIIEESSLYEGLDITHPRGTAIHMIQTWCNCKVFADSNTNKIIIYISYYTKKEYDNLLRLINNLGWFVSMYSNNYIEYKKYNYNDVIKLIENKNVVSIILESKFDIQLDDSKISAIDKLYHISPSNREEKILKIGLSPKSKEKLVKHPERIYLLLNIKDAEFLANDTKFNKNNEPMTVFLIDNKELSLRRKIRFFEDPNFGNRGIYTYENIPPQFISVIKRIEV